MSEQDTHRAIGYRQSPWEMQNSAIYGHAMRLLWGGSRKDVSIAELSQRLWPAVLLRQIGFLYSSKGGAVGYATWAFLTEDCAEQLRADPDYVPHLSEWNEGDQLWLMDVVATRGKVRNLLRKLREKQLAHATCVRALRRRPGRPDARPIRLAIFRAPPQPDAPGEAQDPPAAALQTYSAELSTASDCR
jgi:cytolysin-activating lysine-acyltransferase